MSSDSSVAPKERVNIVFKSATGDLQEDKELPLRLLMLGDYTLNEEDRVLEDIPIVNVNKHNFDDVLESKNVCLNIVVKNNLQVENEELSVSLNFQKMADFSPDSVILQVPELKKLLDVRHALTSLKGPLGNVPDFRRHMQSILQTEETREKLLIELSDRNDKDETDLSEK